MKKITKDKLKVILREHKLWGEGDPKGKYAYLRDADLHCADLRDADLRDAASAISMIMRSTPGAMPAWGGAP